MIKKNHHHITHISLNLFKFIFDLIFMFSILIFVFVLILYCYLSDETYYSLVENKYNNAFLSLLFHYDMFYILNKKNIISDKLFNDDMYLNEK